MGREFHTFEDFRTELNTAVERTIVDRMVSGIKKAIQEAEETNVYSFIPEFVSRRREAGGIKDQKNMEAHTDFTSLSEKTFEMSVHAPWQWLNNGRSLRGGPNPAKDLVETIETSRMYNQPPRPFMDEAGERYTSAQADADLTIGLAEQGFD